jgi:anti-sigma regulatory factor (Ser/Thr protein kinase)
MSHTLTLRFDTDPAVFRAIRRFVADLVRMEGGSIEDADDMELVTGELLNNAHEHAYSRQTGPLEIDLMYDFSKIELTIHDDGEPITDSPTIPTSPPTGARHRGLFLVGQLTDESRVIHPWNGDRGVAVRIVKYLRRSVR